MMPSVQKRSSNSFVLTIVEDVDLSDFANKPVSEQGVLVRDLDIRIGGRPITHVLDGGWALLPTAMTLLNTLDTSYAWKNTRSLRPFFWHWTDLQGQRCCESRLMWNVTHRGSDVTISSVMKVPEALGGEYRDMSPYKTTISLSDYRVVITQYMKRLLRLHEEYAPKRFEPSFIEGLYVEQLQLLQQSVETI